MVLVRNLLLATGVGADRVRLPTLSIDKDNVISAGFDHSADFAHQLHVAFSATYSGACIFAGQPWNCASNDDPERCKLNPNDQDVGSLVDDPRRRCGQNPISKQECVDPVEYMFDQKIFVFRGQHDDVYLAGAVENTVGLVAQMLHEPDSTIKTVFDQPFGHVLPLKSTPHYNKTEPAGYDGLGECLRHVFGVPLTAGSAKDSNWHIFDQTEFAEAGTGFQEQGWIYIPEFCMDFKARCKLVVRADTCAPPIDFAPDASAFADYAEAGAFVLLHPCVGGNVDDGRFPDAKDVKAGKLDVHGELTKDYVEQSAPHMRAIGKMVRRVLGSSEGAYSPVAPVVLPQVVVKPARVGQPSPIMEMPTLDIDRSSILTAGCSNDADFAHQFQVAFSSLVSGSCIFSGQPYHCAVTRFENDYMVPKTWSTAAGIHCDGCDEDGTLIYDHCKNHPEWVDVNVLAEYAENAEHVDDPRIHLVDSRVFSFGPTHDRCYQPPAMSNVAAFHWKYAKHSTQIKLVDDQPFPHTLPTNSTPYFNESDPAGYDGPGHCLKHVFFHESDMKFAVPDMDRDAYWKRINVSEFVTDPTASGMRQSAWLFVPPQCDTGKCKLVILPGGGDAFTDEGPPDGGSDDDFARYGFANGIVVLKPSQGGPIDLERWPQNHENRRGMKDVYGQMTAEYATQKGSQMEPIGAMLKKLLGVSAESTFHV